MRSKKDNEWKIQVGQEAYELFQDKTKDLLPESEEYKKCLENLTGCMIWINYNDLYKIYEAVRKEVFPCLTEETTSNLSKNETMEAIWEKAKYRVQNVMTWDMLFFSSYAIKHYNPEKKAFSSYYKNELIRILNKKYLICSYCKDDLLKYDWIIEKEGTEVFELLFSTAKVKKCKGQIKFLSAIDDILDYKKKIESNTDKSPSKLKKEYIKEDGKKYRNEILFDKAIEYINRNKTESIEQLNEGESRKKLNFSQKQTLKSQDNCLDENSIRKFIGLFFSKQEKKELEDIFHYYNIAGRGIRINGHMYDIDELRRIYYNENEKMEDSKLCEVLNKKTNEPEKWDKWILEKFFDIIVSKMECFQLEENK